MSKKIWTDEKFIEAAAKMRELIKAGRTMNDCFVLLGMQQAMFYTWKNAHPEHFIDFPKSVYRHGSKKLFNGVKLYDGRVRKIL